MIFCPLRERRNLSGLSCSLNSCSLASCTSKPLSCSGERSLPVMSTASPLNSCLIVSIVNPTPLHNCTIRASKTPLGFYFRKIQARSGYIPAIIGTANKLGRIIYTMVNNQTEFDESIFGFNEEERLKRKLIRTQIELEKIMNQINERAS